MKNLRKRNYPLFALNIAYKTDSSEEVAARQKKERFPMGEALKSRSGFTLVEIITVLTIMCILAAVAIPSMLGFVEHGKQVNRMNIARTIYLAAQNQLSKSNLEKNLKAQLTGMYFEKSDGVYTDVIDDAQKETRNVVKKLADERGVSLSEEITDRSDYIHYISKPQGYSPNDPPADETEKELQSFYYMLDEVIMDKAILNDAILMEYNVKTGVVLSIFYGDGGQTEFDYLETDDDDRSNVTGGRGIENGSDGYQYADARKQGYYGVLSTGDVPPVTFNDVANIYDGADDGVALELEFGIKKINVLYAEFWLAAQYEIDESEIQVVIPDYNFDIVDAADKSEIRSFAATDLKNAPEIKDFDPSRYKIYYAGRTAYSDGSFVIDDYYRRYIWVLDYYEGDSTGNKSLSIGTITDAVGNLISPNVRAKATRSGGSSVTSLTIANTHFGSRMSGGKYEIKSARHLNNIRYAPSDSMYRQTKDIDMQLTNNKIANFAPIMFAESGAEVPFAGEYYAMKDSSSQWRIKNLTIDTGSLVNPPANVGLFTSLGSGSNIQGLSLFKASVTAADAGSTDIENVGTIAGVMDGGTVRQSNSYANINVSGGGENVGGLVGHVKGGKIERSFNAGFYNTHDSTKTSDGFGSVTSAEGNIGGLVGLNSGAIQNCFNNARVNVKEVSIDTDLYSFAPKKEDFDSSAFLGGIAGSNTNTGAITASYATNFVADVGDETGGAEPPSTANIGGIAGSNAGTLTDNFYVKNGCTDDGAITKLEMYEKASELSTAFDRGNVEGYNLAAISDANLYRYYPYPTLKSNNPFTDTSIVWGWEDILGNTVSTPGIVYYELYNDATWGYSQNTLDIVLATSKPKQPLTTEASNKLVVNDGYSLEVAYHSGGYKLLIGSRVFIIGATGPKAAATWTLAEDTGTGVGSPIAWNTPQMFKTDAGEIMYRLFIPNEIFEGERNSVNLELYKGSDTDTTSGAVAELTQVFNPLFADKTDGTALSPGAIRSPRHIDNIDIVPTGAFKQELNVDFSSYYRELTASGQKLSLFGVPVVKGEFSGKYNGDYKWIDNLTMTSSEPSIGLFESVKEGEIWAISLDHARINATGSRNVGAIAGTIDTDGNIHDVSVHEAKIYATNCTYVGGIAGIITGGKLEKSRSYANIDATSNSSMNIGGLAGRVSFGGEINQSFNAGFYNAPNSSSTPSGYGSVSGNCGNIGGLVGMNYGTVQNSFNNARVNVTDVSVTKDGEKLSFEPKFTELSAKAYVGGITGYNSAGTVQNTYATNHVSLADTNGSASGGISGGSTESSILIDNFFLANGCTESAGSKIMSKAQLRNNPLGSDFETSYPTAQGNKYQNYPYPVLTDNKLSEKWSYISGRYECGWENIEDVKTSDTGLLYYELYSDGAIGFSGGSFASIVQSGSTELVANDGYVMDIGDATGAFDVKIGEYSYELKVLKDDTQNYTWRALNGGPADGIASVVQYIDSSSGIAMTRFLLFFKNGFLESFYGGERYGAEYIDFEIKSGADYIVATSFNPLFANTIGKSTTNFSVRSPRHFDNINKALGTEFSQGLNLDFSVYSKTAEYELSGTDVTAADIGDLLSYGDNTSIVNDVFTGEYNGNSLYTTVVKADKGLFANIGSDGVVKNAVLENSVIGNEEGVGGIAAENNGTIESCVVSGVTINGTSGIGIVAGVNNGKIVGTHVEKSKVNNAAGGNIGGIAGTNNKTIEKCKVDGNTDISGENSVGGIAGNNIAGTINECTVDKSNVTAKEDFAGGIAGKNAASVIGCSVTSVTVTNTTNKDNVGGIAGENNGDGKDTGIISGCLVTESSVLGLRNNVGGIAGNNASLISKSGVSYSAVNSSSGSSAGGIAGFNSAEGAVEDVFFLSINKLNSIPVSAIGRSGGIVGENYGSVTRAFYHAPAPFTEETGGTKIYPIVGGGGETAAKKGNNDEYETCFYLGGFRYSVDKGTSWTSEDYNRVKTKVNDNVTLSGGGLGLVTKFLDKEWLEFAYEADLTNWLQPPTGYPYLMPTGLSDPDKWPLTDSPTRPEQEDREDWGTMEPTSNRAAKVNFLNGDFTINYGTAAGSPWDFFLTSDTSRVSGWNTRLVDPDPNQPNYGSRNNIELLFCNIEGTNNDLGYFKATESFDAANFTYGYKQGDSFGLTRTNYEGTQDGVYAELNATTQNTLYQVAPTKPETTVIYSFYHATRHDYGSENYFGNNVPPQNLAYRKNRRVNNNPDLMNFYLSGTLNNSNDYVVYDTNGQRLIRPCATPRGYDTVKGTNDDPGKERWTRYPVAYGLVESFYNSQTKQFMSNKYLYDVWLGDDTDDDNGYGVTFWSETDILDEGADGKLDLPADALTKDDVIGDQIIGYWDAVRFTDGPCAGKISQWKQFYGEYKVPDSQNATEFAFESMTENPSEGNLLDGISFKSPAFLSIDKYILDAAGEEAKYVTLNDVLTVELYITSYGEIVADSIKIVDKLAPFDEYIEYIEEYEENNTVIPCPPTLEKNGVPFYDFVVTKPVDTDGDDDQTLTITLGSSETLKENDVIKATFKIKVLSDVKSAQGLETLLFYFKNQAEVDYKQDSIKNTDNFKGYKDRDRANYSAEDLQVFIDPIKLTKTITPDIDGPFTVTLKVEDTLGVNSTVTTKGLITDLIPNGFELVTPPAGAIVTPNSDGSTRIVIQNVSITGADRELMYSYTMKYVGSGYGVTYTSVSADYKYQYLDAKNSTSLSVMLGFPQTVAGIRVVTRDDVFTVEGNIDSRFLDITANDNFAQVMSDSNYNVTPEVVLTDSAGNAYTKNDDGLYQVTTPEYTAILRAGNKIEISDIKKSGTYVLHYQILLTATKSGSAKSYPLSSRVATVTVNVLDDSLVYYEKYDDDSYGFFAGASTVPQALNNTRKIIESGYGVLSAAQGVSAWIDGVAVPCQSVSYNGMYLYKLGTTLASDTGLQTVKFGASGKFTDIGKIHPNFAKAVYPASAGDSGSFSIRTPQQMINIGLVDATGKEFIQERDLDFNGVELSIDGAVVKDVFRGSFDGNGCVISYVTIDTADDNVGLFSQNDGIIRGVILKPDTSIRGLNNVGGIAGSNLANGVIEECIVEGDAQSRGMHIEGYDNVGGIAGLNEGIITDCIVRNTKQTIKGHDNVGGITGLNGTDGIVSGALVSGARIVVVETNFGAIIGKNDNTTTLDLQNIGDSDNMDMPATGTGISASLTFQGLLDNQLDAPIDPDGSDKRNGPGGAADVLVVAVVVIAPLCTIGRRKKPGSKKEDDKHAKTK